MSSQSLRRWAQLQPESPIQPENLVMGLPLDPLTGRIAQMTWNTVKDDMGLCSALGVGVR